MKPAKKSVLLKTSTISDVQRSGGVLAITGCFPVRVNNILDIKQINYKAEVPQVSKVGYSLYTPTADTKYSFELSFMLSTREGYTGVTKTYGYTTPAVLTTLGATAADQREAIHLKLVAKVNADASVPVTAASLLTGTGLTLTDDAGYYPASVNGSSTGRKGPTNVILKTNADGSGWVNATAENIVTTVGVISFGVGQTLLSNAPVVSGYYGGNVISGTLDAPVTIGGLYATAGQNYTAFIVSSLQTAAAHGITGQEALVHVEQAIFVDNGTGTANTNLAGFKSFRRAMQKEMFALYANDASTTIQWFDKNLVIQANVGITPYTGTLAGTADIKEFFFTPDGMLDKHNVGTQTVFAPLMTTSGLNLEQDQTATEGSQYSAPIATISGNQSFIVGKTPFSVTATIGLLDWTDASFQMGFRKKAVYGAVVNAYSDYATIGNGSSAVGTTYVNGDLIATRAELNSAGILEVVSAIAPVDTVSIELRLMVAIDGSVTAFADGVSFPIYSVGTTPMVFDAGDEMVPFFSQIHIGSGDADPVISKFVAIPSTGWII